jgi:hypothetical protein
MNLKHSMIVPHNIIIDQAGATFTEMKMMLIG